MTLKSWRKGLKLNSSGIWSKLLVRKSKFKRWWHKYGAYWMMDLNGTMISSAITLEWMSATMTLTISKKISMMTSWCQIRFSSKKMPDHALATGHSTAIHNFTPSIQVPGQRLLRLCQIFTGKISVKITTHHIMRHFSAKNGGIFLIIISLIKEFKITWTSAKRNSLVCATVLMVANHKIVHVTRS